jgi:undecaprenyl-diphosphatase
MLRRLSALFAALCTLCSLLLVSAPAHAGGGPFGIDEYHTRHDTGIWARNNQLILDGVVLVGVVGTALWEGTDSASGQLAWKTIDSMVATAITTSVMKEAFTRKRPSQSTNPDEFFAGSGYQSFPSGEAAMMAAAVAPAIAMYGDSNPAVWGLLALPIYMSKARMMANGHWLSDVLVGSAVGGYVGTRMAARKSPWVLGLTADGVFVGWKKKF